LTIGTTGSDLTSTVANSTTTPVITLNVPTASATNRGALSSTDWSTFNGKFTLPSLTSGSVLFSDGTTIAQNNANFFWDNTNARLGIGTNVPTVPLEVNGSSRLGFTRSTDIFVVGGAATTNTANARFWSSGGQAVTSGLYRGFYTDISWIPSSGSAEWYGLDLRPTINQTGSANGITRGIYVNPTLTAAADFRAIEVANGRVVISDTSTVTGTNATSLLDLSQTWNTTGAPNAFSLNVTDTASGGASALFRLRVGNNTTFSIAKDGYITFAGVAGGSFIAPSTPTTGAILVRGESITIGHNITTGAGYGVWLRRNSGNRTATSGDSGQLRIFETFGPTSGTGTYNTILIDSTINQTGGANGITRGLYINPTLTAAADFRAIETTAGNVSFGTTGGTGFFWDNTNLGLAIGGTTLDANYALQINSLKGIRISGTGTGFGYSLVRGTESAAFANNGSAGSLLSTTTLLFLTGGTERMRINANGNVLINTPSDAGFKLDVNGTARVKGASNVSATTAFTITNSDSTNLLQVQDNGYIRIGSQAASAFRVYSTDATGDVEPSGLNLVLNSRVTTTATSSGIGMVTINGPLGTHTSGNQNVFLISKGFSPTSGTGTYAASSITPIINQTGGANGVTRGLYINPTLTAAADFRAIETTAGNVIFGASGGTGFFWDNTNNRLGIGTTPNSGFKLTVSGGLLLTGSALNAPLVLSDGNYIYGGGNTASANAIFGAISTQTELYARNDRIGIWSGTGAGNYLYSVSGNFGIGIGANTPSARLQVRGSGATSATTALRVENTNASASLVVLDNGNVLIGATTDAGYKLDVNGTARVVGQTTLSGVGNTSATLALTTQNSDAVAMFAVRNDGAIRLNSISTGTTIYPYLSDENTVVVANGRSIAFSSAITTQGSRGVIAITGVAFSASGGTNTSFGIYKGFAPTSGTCVFDFARIEGTINQTGGANGITRGLYVNPTLTAAADFRAIEVTAGITILGASTTANASLRIPSGTAPTSPVDGDIWFNGTNLQMRIGGVTRTFTLI
jgi:hypothetical protein